MTNAMQQEAGEEVMEAVAGGHVGLHYIRRDVEVGHASVL
jgi:hypothetical protein